MSKFNRTSSRREFLKESATATVGLGCLSGGLKEALAQAQRENKPLLTEQSLNAALKVPSPPPNARINLQQAQKNLAAEIRPDIKKWLKSKFTLTPLQQRQLDAFTAEELEKLEKLLQMIEKDGGTITVKIGETASSNKSSMNLQHFLPPMFVCKVDVKVTTPVGSAEVHIEKS